MAIIEAPAKSTFTCKFESRWAKSRLKFIDSFHVHGTFINKKIKKERKSVSEVFLKIYHFIQEKCVDSCVQGFFTMNDIIFRKRPMIMEEKVKYFKNGRTNSSAHV